METQEKTTGIVTIDGVAILNVTPHPLTFQSKDGSLVTVPTSGTIINAAPVEMPAGIGPGGVELVKTTFVGKGEDGEWLAAFRSANPDVVAVGSILAAQAYPGLVFGMVPAPGFERAAPADKRMRADKFNSF